MRLGLPLMAEALADDELVAVLQHYLTILQGHPSADEMMGEILTDDFQTGFIGGQVWKGIDGLRDFLSQREGFFDEKHTIKELLGRGEDGRDLTAETRLDFFLRSWTAPSPVSEEYTGKCIHHWRVREVGGTWRVAAQMVERFEGLNDTSKRLFATPGEGLNR
jgi:SnoaL-like domain